MAKENEAKERLTATLACGVPRLCICLRRIQKFSLLRQFEPFFRSQTQHSAVLNGVLKTKEHCT